MSSDRTRSKILCQSMPSERQRANRERAEGENSLDAKEERQQARPETAWTAQGAQILLVDDDASILDVSKEILKALGYRVLLARSGEEALRLYQLQHREIDLVILDMVMPGMDGEETFAALKMINPHLRVLIISGYSVHDRVRNLLAQGCRGFLQKPFRIGDLASKVRETIGVRD